MHAYLDPVFYMLYPYKRIKQQPQLHISLWITTIYSLYHTNYCTFMANWTTLWKGVLVLE